MTERANEVLDDIRDKSVRWLMDDAQLTEEKAIEIASKLRDHLRKDLGGQNIYFAKLDDLIDKYKEVYNKHLNGHSHTQLAKEYGTSERHIYRILKKATEERQKERQLPLL